MTNAFQFQDGGRTYSCRVEESMATRTVPSTEWWWVDVSGDKSRYAPFRAAAGDTANSVRSRVVIYYETVLTSRASPPQGWWSRNKSGKGVKGPTVAV